MIPTRPNIRNIRLIDFQRSFITMFGITRNTFPTLSGATAKRSNLFADAPIVISRMIAPAPDVMLQRFICIKTMGQRDSFSAKFVLPHSHLMKTDLPKSYTLRCPYCNHSLVQKKVRKQFIVHKYVNPKCSYYRNNLKKVDPEDLQDDYGKNKYKLHYIYREFQMDFFRMDLNSLPKNASSLRFSKHNSHVMSLCLTYRVNLGLSLRKTAQALKDIHGISISHQQIANYCKTAAICVKPFVDHYDYNVSNTLTADETYIKVRGVKTYIWFIMDTVSRSIIGYQVSDNRGTGPCILAMRMAFRWFKELPENFKFIADAYSAYPLAAQQFFHEYGEKFRFSITQVVGLTNDDAVSKEYRPFKQMIERLNRTYKASYRKTNGFDNIDGANYDLALWVAYYNFLRPHQTMHYQVLNDIDALHRYDTMPDKWQYLIYLGQKEILRMQQDPNCS